jgi:nucleotide-binding universal stress UspA family protein
VKEGNASFKFWVGFESLGGDLSMFYRILAAYDGSKTAEKALRYAVDLTKENYWTKLHVVHVVKYFEYVAGDVQNEIKYEGRMILEDVEKKLTDLSRDKYQTSLLEGVPAHEIVNYAEEHNCDIIVMGNRGFNGMKGVILGSVSQDVLRLAKVPVLIMK